MKIYGYTIIDTEGFEDGSKSTTYIFDSKEKRDEDAYSQYVKELKYLLDYAEVDYVPYGTKHCWEIPDKKEFLEDLYTGSPYIKTHNSQYQIDSWETNIETERRTTITLNEKEIAMIKYSLECMTEEMNNEGMNTDKQGKFSKEYFDLWCSVTEGLRRLMEGK